MNESRPTAICFGEILWDFLPDGLFPGGAPFNVAYHLKCQGVEPHLVSAVGRDLLGDELLRRLRAWEIGTDGIARHQGLPTGYVRASVGPGGDATYEITPSVAWDQIATGEDTIRAAMHAQAIVFGSLSQRSTFNRAALDRLLAVIESRAVPPGEMPPLRVFDVNLRPPYDDLECVHRLAARATLVKLNADEAARLVESSPGFRREEAHARALAERTGCGLICVTAGEYGAGLLREGRWVWEPGRPVKVVDTVGSGDSFLATLLTRLLRREDDPRCLEAACRVGEWVATHRGATPSYDAKAPVASGIQ